MIDALLATVDRVNGEPALASGLDDLAARFAGKRIVAVLMTGETPAATVAVTVKV